MSRPTLLPGHEPAIAGERAERTLELGAANVLDHHLDALLRGQLAHAGGNVIRGVVHDFVAPSARRRSSLAGPPAVVIAPACCGRTHPAWLSQQHRFPGFEGPSHQPQRAAVPNAAVK